MCWSESCLLVSAVKFNQNLKDLFLGDNKLTSPDGQSLGAMLKGNGYLQLLDLRNNPLQVRHTTCNKIVFFFLGSVIHAQHVLEFRFCFRMQFDWSWRTCAMSSELSCMTWEDVFLCLSQAVFICWLSVKLIAFLAPAVERVDNTIQYIDLCLADSAACFNNTYLLHSDLSLG